MTRDLAEITTLQQCQSEGLLRYTSGSSHVVPPAAPNGYWHPRQVTRWIISGELIYKGTSKTVFYHNQRIIVNKSGDDCLVTCADHLHTLNGDSLDYEVYRDSHESSSLLNAEKIAVCNNSAPLVLIATQWSCSNLFHLLFDAIPKLGLAGSLLGRDDYIALIPDVFVFKQVMSALDIKYLAYDLNKVYKGDVFLPSMQHHTGIISHDTISFYQKKSKRISAEARVTSIFVARKAGKIRSIINQDELVEALNKVCRLSVVYFEDFAIREQILIAKEADLIVGAHGAGFSWLVMNERRANIFEIFPFDYHNRCFEGLSYYFGAYGCHVSTNNAGSSSSEQVLQDGFVVDVENCLRDFDAFYSKL